MLRFETLGPGDYDRAKKILNAAKHPGFVGRELFFRCATTGQVAVAVDDDSDAGVAMVAKGKLLALSVDVKCQGRGIGQALMARTQPEWVSAIAERIGWFEKLGFQAVGAPKVGQNGKTAVQLMQRKSDVPTVEIKPATPEEIKPARGERGRWLPGSSGNPSGETYRERMFRVQVRKQSPERVGDILDALYETAIERGDKHVEAARLYLDAVGVIGRTRGLLEGEDVTGVPEEVLRWIAGAQSALIIARQGSPQVTAIDADVAEAVVE